jgi:hypothetical protein
MAEQISQRASRLLKKWVYSIKCLSMIYDA